MDNIKNDHYHCEKIKTDLAFIVKHTRDIDMEELGKNEVLLDSMLFRLIQISENARKLSDGFVTLHAGIPWHAMYGLRNRIVHDYGSVDLSIVYSTLKDDIPELLAIFEKENHI